MAHQLRIEADFFITDEEYKLLGDIVDNNDIPIEEWRKKTRGQVAWILMRHHVNINDIIDWELQ